MNLSLTMRYTAFTDDLRRQGLLAQLHGAWANAALLPWLDLLEWKGDARELADALQETRSKLQWSELKNILVSLGYACQERVARLDLLQEHEFPALFLPDDQSEPFLISSIADERLIIFSLSDQSVGSMDRSPLRGRLITAAPLEKDRQPAPAAGQWFRGLLHRFRGNFRDILVLGIIINLFTLAVPFFTMLTYDRVIGGHSLETLYYLLGGVIITLGSEAVFRVLRARALAWFGVRSNHLIAVAMFERLLALEPIVIERASPAGQVVRIKALEAVRDFFTGQSFILFIEFPFLPVLLLALFLLAPSVAMVCLGAIMVMMLVMASQLRALRLLSQRSARALSERQRDALEIFSKLEHLRITGMAQPLMQRFMEDNERAMQRAAALAFRMNLIEYIVLALSVLGGLAAIAMGVQQVWDGLLTPGGLIASMILAWRILTPMQQLVAMTPRLEQVNGGLQQMEQLLAVAPERETMRAGAPTHGVRGEVELSNVALRYPRQLDPVFSGLNLKVTPGELVVVAGANGSGKSSVLKLVNGMYRQAAGSVRLDGIDIRQLDPMGVRRGISYIAQSPGVFTGTVRDNLKLAAPFASDDMLYHALSEAGALQDVEALPHGLDTVVGAKAMHLSQVLAFKLSLARAYIDIKPLVLFDELPYALLATETGRQFHQRLAAMKGKHTVLAVAHTADLVLMADRVLLMRADQRPIIGKPNEILPLIVEQNHVL